MTSQPATPVSDYLPVENLHVDRELYRFVDEAAMGTGVDTTLFWKGFSALVHQFSVTNRELLARRESLQAQIDDWHLARRGQPHDAAGYRAFLEQIGYLRPEGGPFSIDVANVDTEIATLAGPQLVVPVMNARFALNAANARWGSLYDALYGTDIIAEDDGCEKGRSYNPRRGGKVIAAGRQFLNNYFPLQDGDYERASGFYLINEQLYVIIEGGHAVRLRDPGQFRGYQGDAGNPSLILLGNHGLHVELHIDRQGRIGASDSAGIDDIVLESALTTIMDCEDSIAAVDAEDKIQVYRNWLGLMKGDLQETVSKDG
ncbi:MAG: hypothetical protein M0R02_16865, partial [Bacteroidales bacterium]|nr:hypothetical protein [Bacteroidales bacterium]